MKNGKIDIVIPWVDGNDPEWQTCKSKYDGKVKDDPENAAFRFRDFDLMRYWFRGIEKNMPWVNKIFFVTWGHLPEWLNTDNEKLVIVNHKDYIPEKYLPTFNSNVIELNYHRIKGLSENFIAFNDDFYAIDSLPEEYFFKNDFPCDMLLIRTLVNFDMSTIIWHIVFNNMAVINKYYNSRKAVHKHFFKWVNPCYGFKNNIKNLMKMVQNRISGFYDGHYLIPHKKSVFEKMWQLEGEYLDKVCSNKFRTPLDLNHWLMRYWNFVTGDFEPINNEKFSEYFQLDDNDSNAERICNAIRNKEKAFCVINDTIPESCNEKFEMYKKMLKDAFEEILPEKSSFEV